MPYNYLAAFEEFPLPVLCEACAEHLMMEALLRYRQENPELPATTQVRIVIDQKRRVVVVNGEPTAEYLWREFGIEPC